MIKIAFDIFYAVFTVWSSLQDRQAALYRKIINQERAESEYFLVGFYGEGHPAFLRNTEAVFRGQSYEKLNDFQQRMLATFTSSTVSKTNRNN